MFKLRLLTSFAVLTAVLFDPLPCSAQVVKSKKNAHPPGAVTDFWTPERVAGAKPLPMEIVDQEPPSMLEETNDAPTLEGPFGVEARPPMFTIEPDYLNRLYEPSEEPLSHVAESVGDVTGKNVGSARVHFTSSRLVPLSADTVWPYVTVGKLFFTVPGEGQFTCSATVVGPRLLLTAGHCVHSGTGNPGWYADFMFVPAYRDGAKPLGAWNWYSVYVTSTWMGGGARFPNAADYAMIVLEDQVIGGSTKKIGEVTGWLGWLTQRLTPNHVHILGYPLNLDSGEKMHQVTGTVGKKLRQNAAECGSDMRGGSSGGPWVQNFGIFADGQNGGSNSDANRIVGVTSYGSVSTAPLAQGSSILDSRLTSLYNQACNEKPGNCI